MIISVLVWMIEFIDISVYDFISIIIICIVSRVDALLIKMQINMPVKSIRPTHFLLRKCRVKTCPALKHQRPGPTSEGRWSSQLSQYIILDT
jgi:hypothetical protein